MFHGFRVSGLTLLISCLSISHQAMALECLPPTTVDVQALTASQKHESVSEKIHNPGYITSRHQLAFNILNKKINESIEQQIEHIHCLAKMENSLHLVALVDNKGRTQLRNKVSPNPHLNLAVNQKNPK